jgi:carbamoyltransferase
VRILGISAFYHDSATALIEIGRIVAAAQEERFSRKKYDSRFPVQAIEYCLAEAGIRLDGVERVVFYDKPFHTMSRLLSQIDFQRKSYRDRDTRLRYRKSTRESRHS